MQLVRRGEGGEGHPGPVREIHNSFHRSAEANRRYSGAGRVGGRGKEGRPGRVVVGERSGWGGWWKGFAFEWVGK